MGADVYKKTETGNPVSVRSLARMRPGLNVYGKSTQQTTTGAQLLDIDNIKPDQNGIMSLTISDGGFEWEDTSDGGYQTNRYRISVNPNTNYTLSVSSITEHAQLQISDFLQGTETGLNHVIHGSVTAFTFNSGELSEVTLNVFAGQNGNFKITKVMLCEGTVVIPYEPYTGGKPSPSPDYPQEIKSVGDGGTINVSLTDGGSQTQTLTVQTPNGLPGIPVDSGGNYTDENGQQWICDEIDFKRGKYVQRVIKYTGPYGVMKWDANNSFFLIGKQAQKVPKPEYGGYCNISGRIIQSWGGGRNPYWFLQSSGQYIVIYLGDKYNTEELTQQFMNENEIVVYYVTKNPIETDLTPEQITAYQSLHTNYPTTTVMNDEGAGMKLTYKTRKSLEVTEYARKNH